MGSGPTELRDLARVERLIEGPSSGKAVEAYTRLDEAARPLDPSGPQTRTPHWHGILSCGSSTIKTSHFRHPTSVLGIKGEKLCMQSAYDGVDHDQDYM